MLAKILLLALAIVAVAHADDSPLKCAENEEQKACGACDGTCEEPDVMCAAVCGPPACGCKQGFVRAANKTCVAKASCPAAHAKREAAPKCGENEEHKDCSGCEGDCKNPEPICTLQCQDPKCQCKTGFVRGPNAKCIKKEACPKLRAARQPNPCAFTTCPANTRCDWHPIMCFKAPCPQPEAKCVPLDQ